MVAIVLASPRAAGTVVRRLLAARQPELIMPRSPRTAISLLAWWCSRSAAGAAMVAAPSAYLRVAAPAQTATTVALPRPPTRVQSRPVELAPSDCWWSRLVAVAAMARAQLGSLRLVARLEVSIALV